MAILYDHLTSLLMAGAIVLMLGGLQLRGQRVAGERTMMYTAKKQILSVADVLERDLVNVGAGRPSDPGILAYQRRSIDGVEVVKEFVFWRRGRDGSRAKVKYEVTQEGTGRLGGGREVPLFQWRRFQEQGPGGWEPAGGSPSTLAGFDIDLLDNSGATVRSSNLSDVRQLRVRVVNGVAPGAGPRFLRGHRRLYWGISLRPEGMRGSTR